MMNSANLNAPLGTPNVGRQPFGATECIALIALTILLVAQMTVRQFPDPDMFHEMALWRYVLEHRAVPAEDPFAYTPTRAPVIHHEWGTGAILYHVVEWRGAPGLLALRYALTAGIALLCVWCARRRGASWPVIAALMPLAIFLGHIGLTTVRAQMFTLLAMAALLIFLDQDRRGRRWWIAPWLLIYLLWLNLHAGFVVGLALCGAHWIEQVIRSRSPQWHLMFTGAAMAGLTFINPWGWRYVPFVWESATMARPIIPEWRPMWDIEYADTLRLCVFLFAMLLIVYVMARGGLKRLPGLLILLLCAYAGLRHQRHVSLLAVAMICYLPAFIQVTPMARILEDVWNRHRRLIGAGFAALGVVCLIWMPNRPWTLQVPATLEDEDLHAFSYPIGAVQYLREIDFAGNVMTPFTTGAFVTWHLHPRVKVSQDGRYEVAYRTGVVEEQVAFYFGGDGWEHTLARFPTDLVLVPLSTPVSALMREQTDWTRIYRDDGTEIYARPGLILPIVDRRGQPPGDWRSLF